MAGSVGWSPFNPDGLRALFALRLTNQAKQTLAAARQALKAGNGSEAVRQANVAERLLASAERVAAGITDAKRRARLNGRIDALQGSAAVIEARGNEIRPPKQWPSKPAPSGPDPRPTRGPF